MLLNLLLELLLLLQGCGGLLLAKGKLLLEHLLLEELLVQSLLFSLLLYLLFELILVSVSHLGRNYLALLLHSSTA